MKNILVIPFYQNEHYIDNFVKYFSSYQDECDLFEKICIFNDCPESPGSTYLKEQCALAKFEYIPNEINLGFLKTANRGFAIARDFGANLVLLNSDTLPHKNAFYELLKCFETDSMIGCVAPRSNNATICNLFSAPFYIESDADLKNIVEIFEESKEYVPQISYAPVTNGFCIAIRSNVIKSFPGYSEEFNPGYEEENDYCLRVASHGFRIAIANHGFIGHLEGRSFGLNHGRDELREANHALLLAKYPYYDDLLKMHSHENAKKAYDLILASLKKGAKTVLMDASNLGAYHNGTNKLIVECVKALTLLGFRLDLIANKAAYKFHELNLVPGVENIDSARGAAYFLGFRVGQPFDHGALMGVPNSSIFAVNIFFDTIAIDCPQIYVENPELYGIWSMLDMLYSHISFISQHSLEQFNCRFSNKPSSKKYANLLPRTLNENLSEASKRIISEEYILIIGNKFLHKGVEVALKELPRFVGLSYVVLSSDLNLTTHRGDIKLMPVGEISSADMVSLYANCKFVVFPSYSEGYGFPLVETLSYGKRIYLRDVKCFREIAAGLDARYRALINFTDDFSGINIESPEIEYTQSQKNESYADYMSELISQVTKQEHSEDIYHQLIGRLQLISVMSHRQGLKQAARQFVIKIYRRLCKIAIIRPFLMLARKIALKINSFIKLLKGA